MHLLPLYRQRQLLHYWLGQDEPLPPSKQLIDDALSLTQRSDNDHQTQLDWQGRQQHYTICRYREQLYRLSTTWLKWLSLPLIEHTLTLFNLNWSENSLLESEVVTITLRSNAGFTWQLPSAFETIEMLINRLRHLAANNDTLINVPTCISDQYKAVLRIAPLSRQQRVQTVFATRPQAGKKLYQTLGIPLWLRDSLMVVSLVCINAEDDPSIEPPMTLPILLLSPFDSWILGLDKSVANLPNNECDKVVSSILKLHDTL